MFDESQVLFFDCETTGLPAKGAKWDVDYESFPHIVELAWKVGSVEESHIIIPDGWTVPDEAVEIHGITTEDAQRCGVPFSYAITRFLYAALNAPLICGHNIHFDTSIIKANILRELGRSYYDTFEVEAALYKGKRIDTMRAAMKWVDARTQDGRLKFPNLSELYSRCFPGEDFPAHHAAEDVRAVARCLPVLVDMGLLELKVKVYVEQTTDPGTAVAKIAELASDAANLAANVAKKFGAAKETQKEAQIEGIKTEGGKLPAESLKTSNTEFFGKLTDLLNQNDF